MLNEILKIHAIMEEHREKLRRKMIAQAQKEYPTLELSVIEGLVEKLIDDKPINISDFFVTPVVEQPVERESFTPYYSYSLLRKRPKLVATISVI